MEEEKSAALASDETGLFQTTLDVLCSFVYHAVQLQLPSDSSITVIEWSRSKNHLEKINSK